jgi:hypothetical protein
MSEATATGTSTVFERAGVLDQLAPGARVELPGQTR